MGILVNIYRSEHRSELNKFHGKKALCVINLDGPFTPDEDHPAARLVNRGQDFVVVPVGDPGKDRTPYMDGGSYAATSDSRWTSVAGYSAIPVHDRSETWQAYYKLSYS